MGVPVSVRDIRLNKHVMLNYQNSRSKPMRVRLVITLSTAFLQERNATKIALGHMADDQAETVLMWMLRGSGTGGLSGIPPKRGERIVRPLLDIPRTDIIAYLNSDNCPIVWIHQIVSPCICEIVFDRNLVPHLKEYAPGIVQTLSRQAEMIRDDHTYLESGCRIFRSKFA